MRNDNRMSEGLLSDSEASENIMVRQSKKRPARARTPVHGVGGNGDNGENKYTHHPGPRDGPADLLASLAGPHGARGRPWTDRQIRRIK